MLHNLQAMPWWSGAVFNYIKHVDEKYVVLKARAVNGILLDQWDHDFANTAAHPEWLDPDYWQTAPFTMFVFCPFDVSQGGLSPGQGTMTFPDFYRAECSPDGRLCSFLSRIGTKLYRNSQREKGSAFFKGNFQLLIFTNYAVRFH